MAEITFNSKIAGYKYQGSGFFYHRNSDGSFRGVEAMIDGSEQYTMVATGFTTTARDGSTMAQIVEYDGYDWIDLTSDNWSKAGMASLYTQAQAQDYVNRMIENNKQILMNNLFCARFADKLTQEQKQELFALQERLTERNNRLRQDGLVTAIESQDAYGYSAFNQNLQGFMQSGVGLVVSTTAIVVSCLVLAAVATAAYFCYKYYYEQSAKDVKYSDKLTKTLMSKLTEEEYNQLMQETQGIVTKASLKARLGGMANLGKYLLYAAGAYLVYTVISQSLKTRSYGNLKQ